MVRRPRKLLLLITPPLVLLALVGAAYLYAIQHTQKTCGPRPAQVEVVFLATDIPKGERILRSQITTELIPEAFVRAHDLRAHEFMSHDIAIAADDLVAGQLLRNVDLRRNRVKYGSAEELNLPEPRFRDL